MKPDTFVEVRRGRALIRRDLDPPVDRVVDRVVDGVVDREVDRVVDGVAGRWFWGADRGRPRRCHRAYAALEQMFGAPLALFEHMLYRRTCVRSNV
ncbi:MAG: hypothetical protein R2731_05575 [Nocardioides sp.]